MVTLFYLRSPPPWWQRCCHHYSQSHYAKFWIPSAQATISASVMEPTQIVYGRGTSSHESSTFPLRTTPIELFGMAFSKQRGPRTIVSLSFLSTVNVIVFSFDQKTAYRLLYLDWPSLGPGRSEGRGVAWAKSVVSQPARPHLIRPISKSVVSQTTRPHLNRPISMDQLGRLTAVESECFALALA